MTKKDYKLIAGVLIDLQPKLSTSDHEAVVNAFAGALAADNPAFNRGKFTAACNVDEEEYDEGYNTGKDSAPSVLIG